MKDKKILVDYNDILAWLFVITFFLVSWAPTTSASTLGSDTLKSVTRISYFALALIIFGVMALSRTLKISQLCLLMALTALINYLVGVLWVYSDKAGSLSSLLLCMLFAVQSDSVKRKVFVLVKHFLLAMAIISIICFLSYTFHGFLPYKLTTYYATSKHGVWYANYYLSYLYVNSIQARSCGLFNEPGWFGTFLAFYLCTENLNFKKKSNIIILIAGIFTFSLAFVVIIALYYILNNINNWRRWIWFLIIFVVYLCLPLIHTGNLVIDAFIERISLTEIFSSTSRTTDVFNTVFYRVMASGNKWFGMGSGYAYTMGRGGNLSIRINLIDYGIIGTCVTFIPIIALLLKSAEKSKQAIIFIICVAASQYQRPWIFEVSNFILILSSVTVLSRGAYEEIESGTGIYEYQDNIQKC